MTTLERLIERWKAGDQAAAAEIYHQHREKVFRLSYALVGNLEDAEEATQDALTYALLNIPHFDARRSKFTTWLYMITVSRSRDILRKRRNPTISLANWLYKMQPSQPALANHPKTGPEQVTIQAEQHSTIWQAVQDLPPILREAIVLRHWGGHTYQEIADIVGCPIRTAQSRVRLAYKQLEKILETDLQIAWIEEQR